MQILIETDANSAILAQIRKLFNGGSLREENAIRINENFHFSLLRRDDG
jgi:hypothetical protein